MNLSNSDLNECLYFINFNQDSTSLAVGTKTGYRLYSLSSVDNLDQIYENESEDICIVERLFSSSLVAVVSLSSPRKLRVCHFKKGNEICNYSYSNTILGVKLNRARLVVCLEESLYIHNIHDMKVLHTIRDTPPNPAGLCCLSTNSDMCYLAYPGSSTTGEVQIFDAINLQSVSMISAHDSPLAAMAISHQGNRIATASERGTVIRVFNIADGAKLFEFRRGVKRCVNICSLAFSIDGLYLCSSSNTETVHVFKLDESKEIPPMPEEQQSWMSFFSKAVTASANYLPTQVTDVFTQGRAVASIHLPFQGLKNICTIVMVDKVLRLLVASSHGYLYVYNLDMEEGGDCILWRTHRLDGQTDVVDSSKIIKPKEINNKFDKNLKVETPSSKNTDNDSGVFNTNHTVEDCMDGTVSVVNTTGSYAGVLRGDHSPSQSGMENKQIDSLTEATDEDRFKLNDDSEFPPV
ncbi:WD repeat domain phosphoinositide-interacting protein 2 isoform X3 [Daktulosphaira vitifoliae]|uniref:WD repeat domain phosphoinositide-interacting protein 2 isoform X3 n=1 Tax=Daktulosphaira vitifoliae TaxID=58002 RepID=UPI0021AA03AB|nr:WD repeat domain phosphoinositide-interacting protein 2 isoform X3 [Daktulosphaira vitifoliae]